MEVNIEDLIRERVDQLDIPQMVRDEITRTINGQVVRLVTSEIMKIAQDEAKDLVRNEIKNILSGSVVINDTWTGNKKYDSFELLFKEVLRKECYDKYEISRVAKQAVTELAQNYVTNNVKEVTDIIKEQMSLRIIDVANKK